MLKRRFKVLWRCRPSVQTSAWATRSEKQKRLAGLLNVSRMVVRHGLLVVESLKLHPLPEVSLAMQQKQKQASFREFCTAVGCIDPRHCQAKEMQEEAQRKMREAPFPGHVPGCRLLALTRLCVPPRAAGLLVACPPIHTIPSFHCEVKEE